MEILNIVMRVVHIGSAIALLGGTLFTLAALAPAVRLADEGLRESLTQTARKRFYRIAHPSILLLLLSGAYNWWRSMDVYRQADPMLHMLLGIKVLLAMVIFAVLFAQAFGVLRGGAGRWTAVNLTLGAAIVVLAGVVRHLRLEAMGM